ncbi:MAG: hypothetical protein EOM28_06105 [Clostridia bacterium]|nr:hypothetical protein [Clostridia bacterium]
MIDIKDVRVNTVLPVSERFIDFLEQINSLSYKEREEMAKVKAGIAIQEEEVKKYEWNSGSMQL